MRFIVAILFALSSSVSFAQSQSVGEGAGGSRTPIGTYKPPTSSNGINQDAKKGQATQMIGAAMNGVIGAALMSKCPEPVQCAMGGLAMAQAIMMAMAAKQSGNTAGASNNWDYPIDTDGDGRPDNTPDNTPPPDYGGGPGDGTTPPPFIPGKEEYTKAVNDGWKFTTTKVTTPDGKEYTPDDFKDKDSMMNAGFSAGQAASALNALAKANKAAEAMAKQQLDDANVVAMGVDGGGGGGGGDRSPASDDGLDDYLKRLKNPFGLTPGQKAGMVAGKSLSHGEDQIGVKVDNIFHMIHRCYQNNRDRDQFREAQVSQAAAAKPSVAVKQK